MKDEKQVKRYTWFEASGHPVQSMYVLASDYDAVVAERDALVQRLHDVREEFIAECRTSTALARNAGPEREAPKGGEKPPEAACGMCGGTRWVEEIQDNGMRGSRVVEERCPDCSQPKAAQVGKVHDLKTWPWYFIAMLEGRKTFELRRDDRGFTVGDTLLLREFEPSTCEYTGRELRREITHILRGPMFGLNVGHAILSLRQGREGYDS